MAEQDGQEKTEQPTGKKLQESRDEGKVAKSTEISSFAVFGSGLLILFITQSFLGDQLSHVSKGIFSSLEVLEISRDILQIYFLKGFLFFIVTLSPFFITVIVFTFAINVLQVGFKITPKALKPKLSSLNPIKGMKNKFFSSQSLVELTKSLAKLIIIGLFVYIAISDLIVQATSLMGLSVFEIIEFMSDAALSFLWKIILVYAVLAAVDFIFQKFKFKKDMMMTKQEIKEENKQTDGDPFIKGKIRSKQVEMTRNRLKQEVPTADVVITNPTHYAVALKYDTGKNSAPVVVAKGMNLVAQKIKEIARKNNVPIYEDKPLAQALYKYCSVGDQIPEKLFQSVAKVLAFIYRARSGRKSIV